VVAEQEREQAFAGIVRLRNLTAGLVGALLLAVGLVATCSPSRSSARSAG